MPQARVLDPGSSLLAFFGAELRRRRVAAGMSQDQLGQAITYSAALVGRVEVGERMPSPDLAQRCDDALATGGLFAHLRQSMDSDMHAYPTWFREFVEREREATSIREFSALAIPGLLQTADYARELFRAGRPADTDEEISQHVDGTAGAAADPGSGQATDVLGSRGRGCAAAAGRRCAGSSAISSAHLAKVARHPGVVLQVMPFAAGGHAGLLGEFTLLGLAGGRDVAYTESVESARLIDQADEVAAFNLAFDMIRAVALSPEASLDFVVAARGRHRPWT